MDIGEKIFNRQLNRDFDPETVDKIVPAFRGNQIYLWEYQRTEEYMRALVNSVAYYDKLLMEYKSRRKTKATRSLIKLVMKKKEICLIYLAKNMEMSGHHKELFDAIDKLF